MVDVREIIDCLIELDQYLTDQTDIFVVGSGMLALLGIKSTSNDIDILVEGKQYTEVLKALPFLKKKFNINIDLCTDRFLGDVRLPSNYTKKAKRYRRYRNQFQCIRLWTLSFYDLAITKIDRWQRKDVDDLRVLLECPQVTLYRGKLDSRIRSFSICTNATFQTHYAEFLQLFGSQLKEGWSLFD